MTSLLAEMGLDTNGNELDAEKAAAEGGGGGRKKKGGASAAPAGDDDDSAAVLKSTVRDALKKRLAAALYGLMDAAREGDSERVKSMLLRGLDINATDYDKRTTLHLACAEGNLKVVELLIAEGANVHALDRYGNNGLHYAVVNNHALIAELLARNGAELSYKKVGMICREVKVLRRQDKQIASRSARLLSSALRAPLTLPLTLHLSRLTQSVEPLELEIWTASVSWSSLEST